MSDHDTQFIKRSEHSIDACVKDPWIRTTLRAMFAPEIISIRTADKPVAIAPTAAAVWTHRQCDLYGVFAVYPLSVMVHDG